MKIRLWGTLSSALPGKVCHKVSINPTAERLRTEACQDHAGPRSCDARRHEDHQARDFQCHRQKVKEALRSDRLSIFRPAIVVLSSSFETLNQPATLQIVGLLLVVQAQVVPL